MTASVPIPRVLIVAGSDSGGGAGLQADLKTVTMLGGYAATAVTAVTVQNTLGVSGMTMMPAGTVAAQMHAVLDDIGADAIKLGMLGDAANEVADVLVALDPRPPIVLDPVMIAKGGARLADDAAIALFTARLMSLATLVTPNAPELAVLSGMPVGSAVEAAAAAQSLATRFGCAVLAKGGHLLGSDVTDQLVTSAGVCRWSAPRIDTGHTHGTGCSLASAVALGLAAGMSMADAVNRGRDYVRAAIAAAPGFGGGNGPLGHNFVIL